MEEVISIDRIIYGPMKREKFPEEPHPRKCQHFFGSGEGGVVGRSPFIGPLLSAVGNDRTFIYREESLLIKRKGCSMPKE